MAMTESKNKSETTELDQKAIEQKWQDYWEQEKIYHFDPESSKPIYSIDNPPRYASGPLHVGHAVHYTHIDFAARYKRMRGHNVFFIDTANYNYSMQKVIAKCEFGPPVAAYLLACAH